VLSLKEMKLQFQPPPALQCIEKRLRQHRHDSIRCVCHNDEAISEEKLHDMANAIDRKFDSRVVLQHSRPGRG
jgi:hypothetical protein